MSSPMEPTRSVKRRGPAVGSARSPQLFVAIESARPLAGSSRHLLDAIDVVELGRGDKDRTWTRDPAGGARRLTILVPDPSLSRRHARLTRIGGDRWLVEDGSSKNGTLVNGVPKKRAALADGDVIECGGTLFLFRDAVPAAHPDTADLDGRGLALGRPAPASFSAALVADMRALARAAAADVPLVIRGETGTGKEIVARAFHELSGRPGAFVAIDCGALPEELIESILFGHRKGAFSGATEDRRGLVRSAEGGTLFLDEIGDLPPASQTAFLRLLQEREVTPVGGTTAIRIDLRVVSATHQPLEELIAAGRFRRDLMARLAGVTVRLPPLCERREDLGLLVASLLERHAGPAAAHLRLHVDAARCLLAHDWPLNVRELERSLAAAIVAADHGEIDMACLPEALRGAAAARAVTGAGDLTEDDRLHAELVSLLREHGGNVAAVARVMGKERMQIHRWVKRWGIELGSFRR